MAERGVYPAVLSRDLGMPQPVVHRYVAGQYPRVENLVPIAQYFDVSIEYLLGVTDERSAAAPDHTPGAAKEVTAPVASSGGDRVRVEELETWMRRALDAEGRLQAAERQVAALLRVIGSTPAEPPPPSSPPVSSAGPPPLELKLPTGLSPRVADIVRKTSLSALQRIRAAREHPAKPAPDQPGSGTPEPSPEPPPGSVQAKRPRAPDQSGSMAGGVSRAKPSPGG